jgi:hypothetical protein
MSYSSRPVIERIFEKVTKSSNCWNFTGHTDRWGYGTIKVGGKFGKPRLAHREVFKHFYVDIPLGMLVCHKCDNPPCCNPDHLFLGTHQDNMNDMKRKNRRNNSFGEKSHNHKFSTEIINKIKSDNRPYKIISKSYGVSESHISMIKTGDTRAKG